MIVVTSLHLSLLERSARLRRVRGIEIAVWNAILTRGVKPAERDESRASQRLGKCRCPREIHRYALRNAIALGERPEAQRVQADEAGCVLLVVGAVIVLEGHQFLRDRANRAICRPTVMTLPL